MEVGLAEVGPAEVGLAEGGPVEVGPAEVGPAEVGPVEVGPEEVGPLTPPSSSFSHFLCLPKIMFSSSCVILSSLHASDVSFSYLVTIPHSVWTHLRHRKQLI